MDPATTSICLDREYWCHGEQEARAAGASRFPVSTRIARFSGSRRGGDQVIWWLRERCGKSEEVHSVTKNDLAGGGCRPRNPGTRLPCSRVRKQGYADAY